MADHLSPLVLDTVAAGLPFADTARMHLEGCPECRTRLEAVKEDRAVTMKNSRFAAGLQRLSPAPVKPMVPPWAPRVAGFAIAAGLVAVVAVQMLRTPPADTAVLKGQVTVAVVKEGGTAISSAHVGDRVALEVGGAGFSQVALFAVAPDGTATVLQPSTPLAKGARVSVGKGFEVTPEPFAVVACFADQPLAVETIAQSLQSGAAAQKTEGKSPFEGPVPTLEHGACARAAVAVVP